MPTYSNNYLSMDLLIESSVRDKELEFKISQSPTQLTNSLFSKLSHCPIIFIETHLIENLSGYHIQLAPTW